MSTTLLQTRSADTQTTPRGTSALDVNPSITVKAKTRSLDKSPIQTRTTQHITCQQIVTLTVTSSHLKNQSHCHTYNTRTPRPKPHKNKQARERTPKPRLLCLVEAQAKPGGGGGGLRSGRTGPKKPVETGQIPGLPRHSRQRITPPTKRAWPRNESVLS